MLYTACPINLAQVKKSSVGHFSFIVRALHEEVKAALSISQNCAISYSNGYTPLIQPPAASAMMYGDHALSYN